jgi:hypothetical protein
MNNENELELKLELEKRSKTPSLEGRMGWVLGS